MNNEAIVIIGAGPAGLTAAHELIAAGKQNVIVLEADDQVGGISRTIDYKGNRIDIGGHRFFSKSDWVMKWWADILPIEHDVGAEKRQLKYRGQTRANLAQMQADTAESTGDGTMLVRSRLSRIYYNRRFFDYPLKLNLDSLRKLGFYKTVTFGISYLQARLRPVKLENTLEEFFTNRFGARLYRQFFKEYTEKVWGVGCHEISAEWGAQRIKSLSIGKALWHAARSAAGMGKRESDQTSLIESFIYPKYGPGQMWEEVAERFVNHGGSLLMKHRVVGLDIVGGRVRAVEVATDGGEVRRIECSHVVSTMPIKELVSASASAWPAEVTSIAGRLQYRDFMTVGLLYRSEDLPVALLDNWIYIQEPGVKVGRVQIFNNWSPYMVAQPGTVWLGLEFFCRDTDDLWAMSDDALKLLAQREMREIELVNVDAAQDAVVIRVPKAYPGYFGEAYEQFDRLRGAIDAVENLFPVGRNGMHRYNNQDHSMLTAKEAADQIISGVVDKSRLWAINVDDGYHEEGEAKVETTPAWTSGAVVGAGARVGGVV